MGCLTRNWIDNVGLRQSPIVQCDVDWAGVAFPCQLDGYARDNPRPGIDCEVQAAGCVDDGAAK